MRQAQSIIALSLIAVIALTCGALSLASRSPSVQALTERAELDNFKNGGGIFMNQGGFIDFEDRMLLEEIPAIDFSRGGTYFFGSSTMKWAMMSWELSPEQRTRVHNFGTGASNHKFNAQLVRYLIEHEGLLASGGDKVHIVLTCFWSMGLPWHNGFFSELWNRYGLYRYSESSGIEPVEMNSARHLWITERARLAGFVSQTTHRAARAIASLAGVQMGSYKRMRIAPDDIARRALANTAIPDWEVEETRQLAELRSLVKYLQGKGVRVTVVLMPTRAVYEDMPFPRRYNADVKALVREEEVPFLDLSKLLSDDEFVDVNHANYRGLQKVHRALMAVVDAPPPRPSSYTARPVENALRYEKSRP